MKEHRAKKNPKDTICKQGDWDLVGGDKKIWLVIKSPRGGTVKSKGESYWLKKPSEMLPGV